MSAPLTKTYGLPPGGGTQLFARMAAAQDLRVVALGERMITVEGRENDLALFADRLEQF